MGWNTEIKQFLPNILVSQHVRFTHLTLSCGRCSFTPPHHEGIATFVVKLAAPPRAGNHKETTWKPPMGGKRHRPWKGSIWKIGVRIRVNYLRPGKFWLVVSTHLKNISQNWIISLTRGICETTSQLLFFSNDALCVFVWHFFMASMYDRFVICWQSHQKECKIDARCLKMLQNARARKPRAYKSYVFLANPWKIGGRGLN